jgi:hypothetical protein
MGSRRDKVTGAFRHFLLQARNFDATADVQD